MKKKQAASKSRPLREDKMPAKMKKAVTTKSRPRRED